MGEVLARVALLFTVAFSLTSGADEIRLFAGGAESLAARQVAIQGARSSIDLIAYEIQPCDSSAKILLKAMAERARAGVRVRVIADGYLLKGASRNILAAYLAQNGIELRLYNDGFFLTANARSHIKLLVIDGESYFAGSPNLTDGYFGLSGRLNYGEQDAHVRGASARQAQAAFERLWASRIMSAARASDEGAVRSCLGETARDTQVRSYLTGRARAKGAFSCPVRFYADDPAFMDIRADHNDGGSPEPYMTSERLYAKKMSAAFVNFIRGASRSLNMENQYYLPTGTVLDELNAARDQRHVNIVIVTNRTADAAAGMSAGMSVLMRKAAERDSRGSMAVLQMSSWGGGRNEHGLTPRGTPWILHAKTAVRDHRDVLISSFNLDERSFSTNLEAGLIAEGCPSLARAVESGYKRLANQYMLDAKNCAKCRTDVAEAGGLDLLKAILGGAFL